MATDRSPLDAFLSIARRELKLPDLSLAQLQAMPFAKVLLDTLAKSSAIAAATDSPDVRTQRRNDLLSKFAMSPVVLRAAIQDTFDMAELAPSETEHGTLLAASDIVMIDAKRRLRLEDAVRAEILDAAIGSEPYESLLREAVGADPADRTAIETDPIRLPSVWLRRFLTGQFPDIEAAPPGELKAALAARTRLRLVRRLRSTIPTVDDLSRRAELSELLDPLRLLIGAQGGWDKTPRRDRFRGRTDELKELRAFVDELRSNGTWEAVVRFSTRKGRAIIGKESPDLIMVVARGGLGKSALLAKFVLDHALDQTQPFPFAYLDFDRASLDPERPHQLLMEIARQVGLQFREARPKLEKLCDYIRGEHVRSSTDADTPTTSEIRDPFSQFVEILREHATSGTRAFLLVFDTLEMVQWNASAIEKLAGLVEEFRRKGLTELRLVASGRADVPELRRVGGVQVPSYTIPLKPLPVREAREMAEALGQAVLGRNWNSAWSSAIVGKKEDDDARREPLAVRVAVDLVARADESERQELVALIQEDGVNTELQQTSDRDQAAVQDSTRSDFVARLYERRIINHIRDPQARKLAWPGLVVRRVTKEIARDLLAGFCEISPDEAERAFTALGREIWMVTPQGEALLHRQDLRARTLPLMRRKDSEKFNAIAQAAVGYFGQHRSRSRDDYIEWIYHRFLAEEPPEQIEPDIQPDLLSLLARAEADFPPDSAAASYLAARTARTRMSPRRIEQLKPNDALYHLSVVSAGSFSFDDVSIDPATLHVSNNLIAEPSIRPELFPWARSLQVKAGVWSALPRSPRLSEPMSGPVLRARMYYSARICPTLSIGDRVEFAEQWLQLFRNAASDPERAGFRTVVQAMTLARIGKPDAFAMLDEQAAIILSKAKPSPVPSFQAALRTAIVFGEQCRIPSIRMWLLSRRRGTSERVLNPTVSLAELRCLARNFPVAQALLASVNEESDMPTRHVDEQSVVMASSVIEEILGVADSDTGLRALSRVFAVRDEDWIVPFGYAAERICKGAMSAALSKRLAGYLAPAPDGKLQNEIPDDSIGAMRVADEAGDLSGFSDLVLAEFGADNLAVDVPRSASNHLSFLRNCHAAWRSSIAEIVGTDPATVDQTSVASSERPPEPGPVLDTEDPQKGRWGGLDTRNGRRVQAILESVERNIFYFSVTVESIDNSELEPPVIFHMHPTFPRSVVTIRRIVGGRQATLHEWNAYGVFAIGVQVKDASGKWVALELDLAQLSGLPKRFLDR